MARAGAGRGRGARDPEAAGPSLAGAPAAPGGLRTAGTPDMAAAAAAAAVSGAKRNLRAELKQRLRAISAEERLRQSRLLTQKVRDPGRPRRAGLRICAGAGPRRTHAPGSVSGRGGARCRREGGRASDRPRRGTPHCAWGGQGACVVESPPGRCTEVLREEKQVRAGALGGRAGRRRGAVTGFEVAACEPERRPVLSAEGRRDTRVPRRRKGRPGCKRGGRGRSGPAPFCQAFLSGRRWPRGAFLK